MKYAKAAVVLVGFVVWAVGVMWFNHLTTSTEPLWSSEPPATTAETQEPTARPMRTAEIELYDVHRQ